MKRYCLALDLKNDPEAISEYEDHHRSIWPEVLQGLRESGILNMEIHKLGTRMFMIMETKDDFSFERKAAMDAANPKIQEWEELMWQYQKTLPQAKKGEKWVLMEKIFEI